MELDGFCERLKLAFEYQGEQHFSTKTHYIKNSKNLKIRRADDQLKAKLCKKHNITLLCVPEIPTRMQIEDLQKFICETAEKEGFKVSPDLLNKKISTRDAYNPGKLQGLKDLASSRGGHCLSSAYLGVKIKHEWQCGLGHTWSAVPTNVKKGAWCPQCGNKNKNIEKLDTIENMILLAKLQHGECLGFPSHQSKCTLHNYFFARNNGPFFSSLIVVVTNGHFS